jgi:hypothetical protein
MMSSSMILAKVLNLDLELSEIKSQLFNPL